MLAIIRAHSVYITNALNFRYSSLCPGSNKQVEERACIRVDGELYARCPDCIRLHPAQEVVNETNETGSSL